MKAAKSRCINSLVYWRKTTLLLCIVFSLLYILSEFYVTNNTIVTFELSEIEGVKNGCVFPKINPYDPSILKYIEHPPPVKCRKIQPYLTYMDEQGYLRINVTELKYLNFNSKNSNVICSYKTFDRSQGSDDKSWTFERELILNEKEPVRLSQDMVFVKCVKKTGKKLNKTIYRNLHAHPSKRKNKNFATPNQDQLSVLVNVIDSVSFSEFQRNMPLTFDYVTNHMKMFMFQRLNKIADNTLPVMMAVLTGKRIFPEQNDMPGELNYKWPYSGHYDHYNLIWKDYASKGYATVFNEDQPDFGLFHYQTKGFQVKPVDYYYPIFWRMLEEEVKENKYDDLCYGNVPKGEVLLDIIKRHLKSLNDVLQFIINFSIEYSHDYNNDVQKFDATFARFWKETFEGGYLNNTVVIFMSDHGHRFGVMRKTVVGLLEERNPFYGIWFPHWFYKIHPNIRENLRINAERLSSTFDIHETLKDILHSRYDSVQRPLSSRGLSQLYPIPLNRTCSQAGIPEHHCLCFVGSSIDLSTPILTDAAVSFVKHLNSMLFSYKDQCRVISLTNITRAEKLQLNEKVKDGVKNYETLNEFYQKSKQFLTKNESYSKIRLAIETEPNGAVFEAVLNRNDTNGEWYVSSDVERLNAYGRTSYCMKDVILRKYCTCKKQ